MPDIRIVKTKKAIRETFLMLRAEDALEHIKVKTLCELALINKTTFYKYYQDIYALSDEIENETISGILEQFKLKHTLFVDPDQFFKALYYAFLAHEQQILTLFSGRMHILLDKVQRHLAVLYPALNDEPEKEILLSFLISGASHVLMASKYDEALMLETLSKITNQIIGAMNSNEII